MTTAGYGALKTSAAQKIPAAIWRQQDAYVDKSAAASLINAAPEHSAIPHDGSLQLPTLQHNHTHLRLVALQLLIFLFMWEPLDYRAH